MLVEKILGNINDLAEYKKLQQKECVLVNFEWFELEKKRIKKVAEDKTEFGISVSESLKDGDILFDYDKKYYIVKVLPSSLVKITVNTMEEMGRLGFELGNRHLSLQIKENVVKIPYDNPTYEYLKKLGFCVEIIDEEFTDYIICKSHGHVHGHEHSDE